MRRNIAVAGAVWKPLPWQVVLPNLSRYRRALAAAQFVGDTNATLDGREEWNEDDWKVAKEMFSRLWKLGERDRP